MPEEQAFCINLSSLTDSALEELAIIVEEEQFLRTRRRMACRSASQPATDAPLVEDEQERRQALDGQWYTMEEFRQYYRSFSAWRWYWDRAVLKVVPPGASQPGLSEGTSASTPGTESAGSDMPEILTQPNCMRCDWMGSGVELDSERPCREAGSCLSCVQGDRTVESVVCVRPGVFCYSRETQINWAPS